MKALADALADALFDAYRLLIAERPDIASPKYTEWRRVVISVENALHIDAAERCTSVKED